MHTFDIHKMCTPASVYFWVSIIGVIIIAIQNIHNSTSYHIGDFSCKVPNTMFIFLIKCIYILFWTYILNLICKDGHKNLSWLLVLMPWISGLAIIGIVMMNK